MWRYQKPGFEALLLAELQKQQQCSQFCDTLLKAGDVSVPAHSCVLSAVSPNISSALSSTPVPPAGQSHLLEFRAVDACTLVNMVRLLYSGEMAGEGEEEKQEAILAAAKLGIHGLVEITKRDLNSRNEEGGGQHTDVGVQTEPLMPKESEVRLDRCRREVRDGTTTLWKEIPLDGQKDICTQTEALQVNTVPPTSSNPYPVASLKTIDLSALQGLGQTDSHLVPPQIPYVPISLIYQPDENETPHPSSDPAASIQDSTSAGYSSVAVVAPPNSSVPLSFLTFPNQVIPCAADPQSWWTGPSGADRDVVAGEEWEDEQLEQFQGNIPGFINHFLNPDQEESSHRRQAGRRRRARVRGVRGAGTGERRARRPRGRTGGRGRGGLTQTVDVQDVGVSKLQKLFLQRGGVRASRPGQGGGAVGRKLYLITRDFLKPTKSCRRRPRHSKEWEFSQTGNVLRLSGGGGGNNKQCGGRKTEQRVNQEIAPAGRGLTVRAKPTTSVSLSSPHARFDSVHTLSGSSSSVQCSPCPSLLTPADSHVSPAPSLLHTTLLPPPAPPPNEEQPEHIDRLLEEVMMGLDILTDNNGPPHSDPLDQNSSRGSSNASSGKNLTQNKQQNQTTHHLKACPGYHGSTQVGAVAGSSGSNCANSEVPILQQQEEGELTEILEHFLQSFEQHLENSSTREKEEMRGGNSTKVNQPYTVLSKHRKTKTLSPYTPHQQNICRLQPVGHSQTTELQQSDKAGESGKARAPTRQQKKRRTSQYMFSLEKNRKKSVSPTARKPETFPDQDKQLQLMPVVRLERSGPLPVKVTLQNPANTKSTWPMWGSTKIYPIRSRLKEGHIMDCYFEEPSPHKPGRRRGRPKKNKQLPILSNGEGSTPRIQPQPLEPCSMEEQLEKSHERHGHDLTVQPLEETEGPTRRGKKRGAESEEETGDNATVVKKVCFDQTTEACILSSHSADSVSEAATAEMEDVIDVETVSLTSVGDGLLFGEEDKKTVWSQIIFRETKDSLLDEEMESCSDATVDVDGDSDGITDLKKHRDNCKEQAEKGHCPSRLAPALPHFVSLGSTGSWEDEDIDVIGGSSPLPDPVMISWRESLEVEEEGDEDVDVIGEKTDST